RQISGVGDRVFPLHKRRLPAILEVVAAVRPHEFVANAAKVDPHMRELMGEERPRVKKFTVVNVLPLVSRTIGAITLGRQRMCWRAESEDIEQQAFVITLVAVLDEPVLRPPSMRQGRAAITGPIPVGPTVERIGQVSDLDLVGGVAVEISGDRQGTGEQECRVDGGKLAFPNAATGFDVQEMVEEAFVTSSVRIGTLRACEQVPQSFQGDLGGEVPVEDSALDDDGNRRQPNATGG